jgi:hypothetical protein
MSLLEPMDRLKAFLQQGTAFATRQQKQNNMQHSLHSRSRSLRTWKSSCCRRKLRALKIIDCSGICGANAIAVIALSVGSHCSALYSPRPVLARSRVQTVELETLQKASSVELSLTSSAAERVGGDTVERVQAQGTLKTLYDRARCTYAC